MTQTSAKEKQSARVFEIPVSEFPTLTSIVKDPNAAIRIKETFYGDYRVARRVYPVPPQGKQASFTEPELCLALQLDGVPLPIPGLVSIEQLEGSDAIRKLEPFPLKDKLYLSHRFNAMFLGTTDDRNNAAEYGRKLLIEHPPTDTYTIPAAKFPLPQQDITLLRPTSALQMACTRRYTDVESLGCELDEYIIAHCVHKIGSQVVTDKIPKADPPAILDSLYPANITFLRIFFNVMFALNEEEVSKAVESGKEDRAWLLAPTESTTQPKASTDAVTKL